MPRAAKSPCRHSGCAALLDSPGYCALHHRDVRRKVYKVQRQTMTEAEKESDRFYHRAIWKNVRKAHLAMEPLCRQCRAEGKLTEAVVVDHIIERSQGGADYDHDNLQSLCRSHHDAKTRRQTNRRVGGVKSQ